MTALFLNLNASWWDVYKVDLEGNIKKKNPTKSEIMWSWKKKLFVYEKFKVLSYFLLSFPFSLKYKIFSFFPHHTNYS